MVAESVIFLADPLFFILDPPPSPPTISFNGRSIFYEGEDFSITCSSEEGNPAAVLSWSFPSGGFNISKPAPAAGSIRLEGQAHRDMNGKVCLCKASHPALLSGQYRNRTSQPLQVYCK